MGPAIASTALLFTSSGSSLKIGAVKSSVELSVAAIVGKSRQCWFVVTQLLSSQFLFVLTVINLGIIGFFLWAGGMLVATAFVCCDNSLLQWREGSPL